MNSYFYLYQFYFFVNTVVFQTSAYCMACSISSYFPTNCDHPFSDPETKESVPIKCSSCSSSAGKTGHGSIIITPIVACPTGCKTCN